MKGTIKMYFNAVNTAKVRSRVENPTKEFTAKMRQAFQEAAVEVINANMLDIRAKMIAKFQGMGVPAKSEKYAAELANPLNPYFDCVTSLTPFEGGDEETEEQTETAAPKDDFED